MKGQPYRFPKPKQLNPDEEFERFVTPPFGGRWKTLHLTKNRHERRRSAALARKAERR